jgi:hypothetical protein
MTAENSSLDSLTIFKRPVLIGSTLYTYAKDIPAWGVAQSDLFINRAPISLLLAPILKCDQSAYEQEKMARDKLGWTSSEVLVKLKEKGLLEPIDLGPTVRPLFQEKPIQQELDRILNSDVPFPELLPQIRSIDNTIMDGILAKDTNNPAPDPKSAFFWQGDPLHSGPFWSKSEKIFFSLFFDSDFYILPPREIWPPDVREAMADISRLQAPLFEQVVRLRLDAALYVRKIKELHGKHDKIVDKFLKTHSASPYGNYQERLDLLFKARQALHGSGLFENLVLSWERVRRQDITENEFRLEFDSKIKNETNGLLKAIKERNRDISIYLVSDLVAYGIATAGALTSTSMTTSPLVTVGIGGTITLTAMLVRSIYERYNLKLGYNMGWFNLAKKSISPNSH